VSQRSLLEICDGVHRDLWFPTLRKKREGPRTSYRVAPALAACAAFYKESRMKFVDPTRLNRKSGGMGHPQFCCRARNPLGFYCFELRIEAMTPQQIRQVLGKSGFRHHHVTTRFHCLRLQVTLQVGEKTDD
jgi:hypothetical protein